MMTLGVNANLQLLSPTLSRSVHLSLLIHLERIPVVVRGMRD